MLLFHNNNPDSSAGGFGFIVPGGEGALTLLGASQGGQIVLAVPALVDGHVVGQGIFASVGDEGAVDQLSGLGGGEGPQAFRVGEVSHDLDGAGGDGEPGAGARQGVGRAVHDVLIAIDGGHALS